MSRKSVPIFLLAVIGVFAFLAACTSGGGSDGGDEPVFTPGDYNKSDGDADDDSQNVDLPDCRTVCVTFCTMLNDCVNNISGQELEECRSACRKIQENQSWPKWVSCGEKESCIEFLSCRESGGSSAWQYDPGDPLIDGDDTSDGDGDNQSDGDETEAEEEDDLPVCTEEIDCPNAEDRCDTVTHHCAEACDPFNPTCSDGKVCRVLTIGDLAGEGKGVCAKPNPNGRTEGEVCNASSPCVENLICDSVTERCENICNSANPDLYCEAGLRCESYPLGGVGICRYCNTSFPCEAPEQCVDGHCRSGETCDSFEDCTPPKTCMMGYCEPGCTSTGCQQGECDTTTGYCNMDYCPGGCGNGECCNRSTCGPCCSQDCGSGTTCAYDPACTPNSNFCCVERPDCRSMPKGWCEPYPCNKYTGECSGECPASCPFMTHCSEGTYFECLPDPVKSCEYDPMNSDCASENFCFRCDAPFAGSGKCVATTACAGVSCLSRGVPCTTQTTAAFLPCCAGMQCLQSTTGGQTCCPPEDFDPVKGCVGDETEPVEIDCTACEAMQGDYCLPANPGSCLQSYADLHHELTFEKYYDPETCYMQVYDGSDFIKGFNGCAGELIESFTYGSLSCVLFWDGANERFLYNCTGSGACQLELKQSNCSK